MLVQGCDSLLLKPKSTHGGNAVQQKWICVRSFGTLTPISFKDLHAVHTIRRAEKMKTRGKPDAP